MSKDKEAAERQQEGHNHYKIKSHFQKVGDPQNNTKEVLPLLWRFWIPCQASQSRNLTKELIPSESDLEGQWDLTTRFSQARGNRDSSLGGHKQNLVCTKTRRKGALTPQDTEPKLPASVEGSPVEVWVGRGSPQGWEYWQQQSGKVPFGINPLGGHH